MSTVSNRPLRIAAFCLAAAAFTAWMAFFNLTGQRPFLAALDGLLAGFNLALFIINVRIWLQMRALESILKTRKYL